MIVTITLTIAGTDTGPFNLYSNVDGFVSAFEVGVPKASLLAGYTSFVVPDGTAVIRVMSDSICTNYIDIVLKECYCYTVECITTGNITIQWTSCDGTENSVSYRSLPGGIWGPACCQKNSITVTAGDPYTIYGGTEPCLVDTDCYSTTTTTTSTAPPPIPKPILIQGDDEKTYLWNYVDDTLTEIVLSNDVVAINIAFTTNKIWKYYKDPVTRILFINEWDFNIVTLATTFNRTLQFSPNLIPSFVTRQFIQSFNAVADDKLVIVGAPFNSSVIWTVDLPASPSFVIDPNSSYVISNEHIKVSDTEYKQSILTTQQNKIIIMGSLFGPVDCDNLWIAQYDYNNSDVALNTIPDYITPVPMTYSRMAVVDNYIYVFTSDPLISNTVLKIDTANPGLGFSPVPFSSNIKVNSAASLYSNHDVVGFQPNVTCQTIIPNIGETITYNGISMTGSGGGAVIPYAIPGEFYPPVINCSGGFNVYNANMGFGLTFGFYTYTITFDTLVNDIILNFSVLDIGDTTYFSTNAGTPSLSIISGCGAIVNNNSFEVTGSSNGYCYGGKFKVTANAPYSELTFTSATAGNGYYVTIDCDSLVPSGTTTTTSTSTTNTTSTTTTITPPNANTVYTYFTTF